MGESCLESRVCEIVLGDKLSFSASDQDGKLMIIESGLVMNGDDDKEFINGRYG